MQQTRATRSIRARAGQGASLDAQTRLQETSSFLFFYFFSLEFSNRFCLANLSPCAKSCGQNTAAKIYKWGICRLASETGAARENEWVFLCEMNSVCCLHRVFVLPPISFRSVCFYAKNINVIEQEKQNHDIFYQRGHFCCTEVCSKKVSLRGVG